MSTFQLAPRRSPLRVTIGARLEQALKARDYQRDRASKFKRHLESVTDELRGERILRQQWEDEARRLIQLRRSESLRPAELHPLAAKEPTSKTSPFDPRGSADLNDRNENDETTRPTIPAETGRLEEEAA